MINYSTQMEKALRFAIERHGDQKYGDKPYSYHLVSAVKIARKFDFSNDVIIACYLHDLLEDTNSTYHEIKTKFGKKIAELVYAVTDERGRNRKERKAKTRTKIIREIKPHLHSEVVELKLCDLYANVLEGDKNEMYKKEWPEFFWFYNPLHNQPHHEIWVRLVKILGNPEGIN